ncbi:unnamed protein product [Heligmosomoides polygyrus]|uniref:CAP-Gly domain-containing protein n=1 Tax=Heligmosomoides polygyrus TaxID=6339 RepID=A0A183F3G7_HELPZ|nr:unnamed protein product [Heligmosomoides polygyrus]
MMPSEQRVIPIRRLDTSYEPRRTGASSASESYGNELISWNDDARYERRRKPELIDTYDEYEPNHFRERADHMKDRETRQRSRPQNQAPARSQSSHAMAVHDRTFRVDDPVSTGGAMVGDRCVWVSEGVAHKGTIKFIGHLKGHSNLYAGVDFDERVGKGTGVFQGEVLFQTPENHAGFVLLSALEVIPRSIGVNGSANTRHISVIQKQASAESLRDMPSPPVPPRPVMRAEDYMIDSFTVGRWLFVILLLSFFTGWSDFVLFLPVGSRACCSFHAVKIILTVSLATWLGIYLWITLTFFFFYSTHPFKVGARSSSSIVACSNPCKESTTLKLRTTDN